MTMDLPALLLKVVGLLSELGLLLGNIGPLSLHHLPGSCHALRLGLNLDTANMLSKCCCCCCFAKTVANVQIMVNVQTNKP